MCYQSTCTHNWRHRVPSCSTRPGRGPPLRCAFSPPQQAKGHAVPGIANAPIKSTLRSAPTGENARDQDRERETGSNEHAPGKTMRGGADARPMANRTHQHKADVNKPGQPNGQEQNEVTGARPQATSPRSAGSISRRQQEDHHQRNAQAQNQCVDEQPCKAMKILGAPDQGVALHDSLSRIKGGSRHTMIAPPGNRVNVRPCGRDGRANARA
jgi:hypothetical protein